MLPDVDIFRRKAVEGKRFHILKADLAFTAVVIFEQFRKSFVNVVFHHIYKHNTFPFALIKRFESFFTFYHIFPVQSIEL